ncbi:MAG: hypothetical protein ABJA98_01820 [Acidobacteriota bacterium]
MSFDTAMDYGDAQDGEDFFRDRADVGSLCDACCDRRDAHTSALERRMVTPAAPRQWAIDRLPTLSAVAASRAGKPIPKKPIRRREVA